MVKGHDGDLIHVRLHNKKSLVASVVQTYPESDLAVLRLRGTVTNLRPIPLGRSSDLQVGQAVYAIGNPLGLDHTLSTGVISAMGRSITTEIGQLDNVIQVDATINPGNSGGPLLDSAGRLIGMNTAITTQSGGIGFAVPADDINEFVPQLIAGKRPLRPLLGIKMARTLRLSPYNIGYDFGVAIATLSPGFGAEAAGLKPFNLNLKQGDVIAAVDDKPVETSNALLRILAQHKDGDKVQVTVARFQDGKPSLFIVEITLQVNVTAKPND